MLSGKPLVLLVDSDSDVAGSLYNLLEDRGYVVATRTEGMEAVKYAAQTKPELVICAARVNGMDGKELITRIRRASPDTGIILRAPYLSRSDGLALGADEVLRVPCKYEEILSMVVRAWVAVRP